MGGDRREGEELTLRSFEELVERLAVETKVGDRKSKELISPL